MKKWLLKAIVQKVISWLPASQKINYWFQKNITKGVILSDQHFGDKLTHAIDHLHYFHKYGGRKNYKALELGSGWYPVVPVALFLNASEEVHSIDISPLMRKEGIEDTIRKYVQWRKENRLEKLEPFIKEERWKALEMLLNQDLSMADLLKNLRLNLLITDARHTGFEDNYFDLVCSNNTYEHIYSEILEEIIPEFQRVLKPGGVNSHFIDMSDHFAHLDQSITIYNFLRFSKSQWKRIDNSVQPQNRLRKKDYEQLYASTGIKIVDSHDRPGSIAKLKQTPVHKEFAGPYSEEELAVSHTHLVNSKK